MLCEYCPNEERDDCKEPCNEDMVEELKNYIIPLQESYDGLEVALKYIAANRMSTMPVLPMEQAQEQRGLVELYRGIARSTLSKWSEDET